MLFLLQGNEFFTLETESRYKKVPFTQRLKNKTYRNMYIHRKLFRKILHLLNYTENH